MKSKVRLIVLVGLLAALAFGMSIWIQKRNAEPTFVEAVVERGSLETTVLSTGIVKPENRVEVKSPIAGRAESVLVREGEKVRRGQTLVWMSSSERAALLDAARARGPEETKRWEELYKPTPILAPVRGTVIQRQIEPGQTFSQTDSILVMSDRLIVEAQVDETDLARVKIGQRVQIILDAYPDRPIVGQVISIAFEATTVNNVTTYIVKVAPDEAPDFMRSGMTANVRFEIESRKGILLIPSDAIKVDGGAFVVLVKTSGDQIRSTPISTGLSDGKRTEVTQGVNEGDIVLIPSEPATEPEKRGTNPFAPVRRGRNR